MRIFCLFGVAALLAFLGLLVVVFSKRGRTVRGLGFFETVAFDNVIGGYPTKVRKLSHNQSIIIDTKEH